MSNDNWKNLDRVEDDGKAIEAEKVDAGTGEVGSEKILENDKKNSQEKTGQQEPIESKELESGNEKGKAKKRKPKQQSGKSSTGKVIAAVLILASLAVGAFAVKTRILNGEQDAKLESNISTLRADLEKANSDLELKVLDLKESLIIANQKKINDLSLSLANERELTIELQNEIANLKRIITSQNETSSFNEQLLDVLSKDQDRLKVEMANYKSALADLNNQIKNLPKNYGAIRAAEKKEVHDVIQVANHKLFNIDLWGSEKLAVFIQGDKITKVKEGDFFHGHVVTVVDSKHGLVLLTKDDKKIRIQVSE